MKLGIWFYGLGTLLTGVLNVAWGAFDPSHQPLKFLSGGLAEQHTLAYGCGIWLMAAGLAMFWPQSVKIGAGASAIAYLIFALLWLPRYFAGIHALGWKLGVLFGVSFGLAQQIMLAAPGVLISFDNSSDHVLQERHDLTVRWMLGLPAIIFGLFHLTSLRIFASIVPHWMGLGYFWATITGIAFILGGTAICWGSQDVLAAKLLALMLLLFEGLVEIPPILNRLHNEATWGAAAFNLTAIGAYLIFAESLRSQRVDQQIEVPQETFRHTSVLS